MKPILLFICLLSAVGVQAQETEKRRVWKVELAGALNNYDAWEAEPSITYQPIPYAGITMGLLFCNPIADESKPGYSRLLNSSPVGSKNKALNAALSPRT